jgi:hypothetical protein
LANQFDARLSAPADDDLELAQSRFNILSDTGHNAGSTAFFDALPPHTPTHNLSPAGSVHFD